MSFTTHRFARTLRSACLAAAASAILSTAALAQAPAAPAGPAPVPASGPTAVGVNILHLNVTNLQQSLAFYRDVLGMEMTAPLAAPRAGGALVTAPGAMLQTTILKVPGGTFSMELIEWTGTPLRAHSPRIQDPGEVMLAFNVRDMAAKIAGAKKLGLKVLSKDGVPYVQAGRGGGQNVAIMIQDPTGFVVELTDNQAALNAATMPPGPISSVAVYVTAADLAQTVNFYNKAFGFSMPAPMPAGPANDRIKGLFGAAPITTVRMARGVFPGSEFTINFQEFAGADRKAVHHRAQDPGGPILLVTVRDFPAVIEQIKANGGTIGEGDTSAPLSADARTTWARDPNGVLLRVSLPAQPRAGAPNTAAAPAAGRQ